MYINTCKTYLYILVYTQYIGKYTLDKLAPEVPGRGLTLAPVLYFSRTNNECIYARANMNTYTCRVAIYGLVIYMPYADIWHFYRSVCLSVRFASTTYAIYRRHTWLRINGWRQPSLSIYIILHTIFTKVSKVTSTLSAPK
jgi:hypothetical protein